MVLDFTYKPCKNTDKLSSSKDTNSTSTSDEIQMVSLSKPVFVSVNKAKNKQTDLKSVKKTSKCKQLSEKMKKIDFNELPGEFGIVMAKQKKRVQQPKEDVIEIIDSDDERESPRPISKISKNFNNSEVEKKSSQQSQLKSTTKKTDLVADNPFLNALLKPQSDSKKSTNSEPVNSKSGKKLNLQNLEKKLKPGDKRPAYVDGMNVLYYHPDQNNPKKPKQKQGLNFNNLIAVVKALQKLGYDPSDIKIVVQAYVKEKYKTHPVLKPISDLLVAAQTRYISTDKENNKCKTKPNSKNGKPKAKRIESHDDLTVIELAESKDGIIITNDNYREHVEDWMSKQNFVKTEFVAKRSLNYTILSDVCVFPADPMGKKSKVCLEQFITVQK